MDILIGTSDGLLVVDASGARTPAAGLSGRTIRALLAANGSVFAGADDGVYRSTDGGRSWRPSGAPGQIVWELAGRSAEHPHDPRRHAAGRTLPQPRRRRFLGEDRVADAGARLRALVRAQQPGRCARPGAGHRSARPESLVGRHRGGRRAHQHRCRSQLELRGAGRRSGRARAGRASRSARRALRHHRPRPLPGRSAADARTDRRTLRLPGRRPDLALSVDRRWSRATPARCASTRGRLTR